MISTVKGLYYPEVLASNVVTSMLINNNTTKWAFGFQTAKTGNVTHVCIRVNSVSSAADIKVRIETLDGSYAPSGTLVHANAEGTLTSPAAGTYYEVAMAGDVPLTIGTPIAIVMSCPIGTPNLNLSRVTTAITSNNPYTASYNGTSWTKFSTSPVMALKYDDGTYPFVPNAWIFEDYTTSGNFNMNSGTFDEIGNVFSLPFDLKIEGAWCTTGTTTGSYDYVLYDDADGVLLSEADKSCTGHMNAGTGRVHMFSTEVLLKRNNTYRFVIKPTSTTNISNKVISWVGNSSNAISGTDLFMRTQRVNGGSWTDVANSRSQLGFIVSGIQDRGTIGGRMMIKTSGSFENV